MNRDGSVDYYQPMWSRQRWLKCIQRGQVGTESSKILEKLPCKQRIRCERTGPRFRLKWLKRLWSSNRLPDSYKGIQGLGTGKASCCNTRNLMLIQCSIKTVRWLLVLKGWWTPLTQTRCNPVKWESVRMTTLNKAMAQLDNHFQGCMSRCWQKQ